jgi:hypothetical protein
MTNSPFILNTNVIENWETFIPNISSILTTKKIEAQYTDTFCTVSQGQMNAGEMKVREESVM